ncbi:MAG: hypothetical protein II518_00615, partial [Candidatus Methanomethylophilus sp.]|nr:hypothetical protein [Methanomethylophilus sp.]
MAEVNASYGFISSESCDLSVTDKIYSTSLKNIALLPLSKYLESGVLLPSGVEAPSKVKLLTREGDEVPVEPSVFTRYLSSGYYELGTSPAFDYSFNEAVAQDNGFVDDFWMFFDTNVPSAQIDLVTHLPTIWWVRRTEDGPVFKRIAFRLGTQTRIKLFVDDKTTFRYFYAIYPISVNVDSVCCVVTENSAWYGAGDNSYSASESDKHLINLGVLQDGTRGVTATGGTPDKAGFLAQLGKDGMFDESLLPSSYQGFSTALSNEAEARKIADTSLGIQISDHENDKENPHEVTKEQLGLGNVDNTSDLDKPVSTAVQAALDDKLDKDSAAAEYAPKYYDESNGITLVDEIDSKQDILEFDDTPTEGSVNPVKSDGIKSYVDSSIDALVEEYAPKYYDESNGITLVDEIDSKQDLLEFDDTPTDGSSNPVKSGGVKSYVDSEISGV